MVGFWVRQSRGGVVQGYDSLSPPGGRVVYQIFEGHITDLDFFLANYFFRKIFFTQNGSIRKKIMFLKFGFFT